MVSAAGGGPSKKQRLGNIGTTVGFVSEDITKRKSSLFARKEDLSDCKLRAYKIKMFPNPDQKRKLKEWYAASNRSYNKAVEILRASRRKESVINIRKLIVPKAVVLPGDSWVLKVPVKVRARAVQSAVQAHNAGMSQKGRSGFRLGFRSYRKDQVGTIIIEKAFERDRGPIHSFESVLESPSGGSQKKYAMVNMAPRLWGNDGGFMIKDRHWLIDKLVEDGKLMEDAKIIWDKRDGSFYLSVLVKREPAQLAQEFIDDPRVVSLDPGVRAFNTYYCPDGTHGELLKGAKQKMEDMCKTMDWWKSTMPKYKKQHKADVAEMDPNCSSHADHRRSVAHMQRSLRRASVKLMRWRTNIHYNAVNFLLSRFDVIILPEFESQKMAAKEARAISSPTVRSMLTWSHYQFRQRLLQKVELMPGKMVRIVGEPGTSKTCGLCGFWNAKLGGHKVFRCPSCGVEIDRDVNGARNNLLAQIE